MDAPVARPATSPECAEATDLRFQAYFERAPQGVLVTDGQGRCVEVNPAATRITGYSTNELSQLTLAEMLPSDAVGSGLEVFASLRQQGHAAAELPFVGKDGRRGWWALSATKLSEDRFLVFVTDISDRKRTEESLRSGQRQLRQILDSSFGFICLMDLEGTVLDVNRPPLEAAGLTLADVVGRKAWETGWWSFDPVAQTTLRRAIEGAASGETVRFESPIRARGNELLYVDVSVGPLRDEDDVVVGLIGFSVDVTERHRSAERLRWKTEALEKSLSAVAFADPEGRLIDVNTSFLRLWGFDDRDAVLGRDVSEFCADPDFAAEVIDRLFQCGQWLGELAAKRSDGSKFMAQVEATLIRDAAGRPQMLMGSILDITERKRHEDRLRISEAKYRSLIEGSRDMIFRMSIPDGRYEYASPAAERVVGFSAEDLLSEPKLVARVIHPDDRDWFVREWDKVCRGIVEPYFEYSILDGAGNRRWISQSTVGIYDDSGNIVAIEGMCRDAMEQKLAQEQLRASEAHLRAILNATPDCIKVVDRDCRLLEINRAGIEIFEADSAEEILGLDISQGVIAEHREAYRRSIQDAASGLENRLEFEAVSCRGTRVWIEHDAVALFGGSGVDANHQVLAVARDVTLRRQMEADRKRSEDRYRLLFEMMTEGMSVHEIVCDSDGRPIDYIYLDVNPAFERLVGKARDQVVGKRQTDFPSTDTQFWIEQYGEVALTGRPLRLDFTNSDSGRNWLVFAYRTEPLQFVVLFSETTEWKRVEREVRESQSRLQMILDNTPIIVFSFGKDGVLTLSEGKGLAGLGLKPGELVGRSVFDLYAHSKPPIEAMRRALAGEDVVQFIEGPQRGLKLFYHPVRGADGDVTGVSGIALDVTDRMLVQRALQESEARLRIFVESAPAGVAMLDRDMRYLACSRRWLSDYDLGDQDLLGRSHYEVFPDIPERWKQVHRRCLTGVAERCEEDPFEHADGSVTYFRWEIQPWRNALGEVGGLVFFTEVITERVLGARALKQSEARLAEAQRIAHLGHWVWDVATNEISWSDEVYRIFGHPPKSFAPRYETDFLPAVHDDDRQLVLKAMEDVLRTRERCAVEHRIVRPDRTVRFVREEGELETDGSGQPLRMIGTVQDITDRMVAQAQAEHLSTELAHLSRVASVGELAAGIAHELNQPLAAIANYAFTISSILEQKLAVKPDASLASCLSLANLLEQQAIRAGEIIRGLQRLVRKQAGTRELTPLRPLVIEVLALLSPELKFAAIDWVVQIPDELPLVLVDPVQIQQVLFNLIRNAIEALRTLPAERERRLDISAETNGNRFVVVRIRDWGPGVAEGLLVQLFSPFVTTKPSGLGVGLAISRRIIESHGGQIWVSPDVNPGLELCYTLPIAF